MRPFASAGFADAGGERRQKEPCRAVDGGKRQRGFGIRPCGLNLGGARRVEAMRPVEPEKTRVAVGGLRVEVSPDEAEPRRRDCAAAMSRGGRGAVAVERQRNGRGRQQRAEQHPYAAERRERRQAPSKPIRSRAGGSSNGPSSPVCRGVKSGRGGSKLIDSTLPVLRESIGAESFKSRVARE